MKAKFFFVVAIMVLSLLCASTASAKIIYPSGREVFTDSNGENHYALIFDLNPDTYIYKDNYHPEVKGANKYYLKLMSSDKDPNKWDFKRSVLCKGRTSLMIPKTYLMMQAITPAAGITYIDKYNCIYLDTSNWYPLAHPNIQ